MLYNLHIIGSAESKRESFSTNHKGYFKLYEIKNKLSN